MADSQSGFAALPPKQKVTVVLFLMIAIFVVWEVVGLFWGDSKRSTLLTPSQPAVAASAPLPKAPPPNVVTPAAQTAASPKTPPHLPNSPHLTPQQSHPEVEVAPPSSIVLEQQEQVQNKYVSALNELQMLKIQKEIAETSQAIVTAKLATATAEKSISQILTEAQEANAPPSEKKGATSVNVPPVGGPPPPVEMSGAYSVQSVTLEQDKWHAVLKFKDKLYDVSIGDMLPPDRSLVKAIDQDGVTLENAGMEQRIPLTMTDNEPPTAASDSSSSGAGMSISSPPPTAPPPSS